MAELVWAPSAIKDIENIAEYIGKDSQLAASNMVERFFERAEILVKYPTVGTPTPELKDNKYRQILCGRYRIIYKLVSEQEVYILTVHHQARLLENNPVFKKRLRKKK